MALYYRRSRLWWLIAVMLLVFGFYRGWLAIEGPQREVTGRVNVGFSLDPNKVKQDAREVKEIATQATEKTLNQLPDRDSTARKESDPP